MIEVPKKVYDNAIGGGIVMVRNDEGECKLMDAFDLLKLIESGEATVKAWKV